MGEWTLDELVRRAARALAASDVRAPNGRVTERPDARMIRWYATKGIVDRPSGTRGRSALYGPRHLLQVVAVKRLQARGHSLAEIQARLAGATDADLRRLADLPGGLPEPAEHLSVPADAPQDSEPDAADSPPDSVPDAADSPPESEPLSPRRNRSDRFWTGVPTTQSTPPATSRPNAGGRDGVLHGVALADGVLLLLPATPDPEDLEAIRAASGPLIETLRRRGLTARTDPQERPA